MEDPKRLVQEASGYLRKAESSMFSGKNQDKEENPDGTFGRVVSHILFEEQMAEENIAVV